MAIKMPNTDQAHMVTFKVPVLLLSSPATSTRKWRDQPPAKTDYVPRNSSTLLIQAIQSKKCIESSLMKDTRFSVKNEPKVHGADSTWLNTTIFGKTLVSTSSNSRAMLQVITKAHAQKNTPNFLDLSLILARTEFGPKTS